MTETNVQCKPRPTQSQMEDKKIFTCHLEAEIGQYPEYCIQDVCCGIYKQPNRFMAFVWWLIMSLLIVAITCCLIHLYFTYVEGKDPQSWLKGGSENKPETQKRVTEGNEKSNVAGKSQVEEEGPDEEEDEEDDDEEEGDEKEEEGKEKGGIEENGNKNEQEKREGKKVEEEEQEEEDDEDETEGEEEEEDEEDVKETKNTQDNSPKKEKNVTINDLGKVNKNPPKRMPNQVDNISYSSKYSDSYNEEGKPLENSKKGPNPTRQLPIAKTDSNSKSPNNTFLCEEEETLENSGNKTFKIVYKRTREEYTYPDENEQTQRPPTTNSEDYFNYNYKNLDMKMEKL